MAELHPESQILRGLRSQRQNLTLSEKRESGVEYVYVSGGGGYGKERDLSRSEKATDGELPNL